MEGLEKIQLQLQSHSTQEKINALLDALLYGQEGLKLITQALSDRSREVRQSAFLLLSESNDKIAKEGLENYLPFEKMQCLHTLTEFNLNYYYADKLHPYYFSIADYNNTLFSYWDVTYKSSTVNVWDLETGKHLKFFEVFAHEFGLGKQGKVCIVNFQYLLWVLDTKTQREINSNVHNKHSVLEADPRCFTVCPTKPLVAIGYNPGLTGELEVWNYETFTRQLHYRFQDVALAVLWKSWPSLSSEDVLNYISPFLFTPDGQFLGVVFRQKKHSIVQLWNVETGQLFKTIDNLPLLIINALAIRPDGKFLACGMRENMICVWELISDQILQSFSGIGPCLISSEGRFLIYCTDKYEIVIWDLVENRQLGILQEHTAPIAYIAISSDREFIASYSIDRSIKIWGVPEPEIVKVNLE